MSIAIQYNSLIYLFRLFNFRYGFTEPPELKIHLNPILGRWISLDYKPITNALEKQLQYLFHVSLSSTMSG